MFYVLFVCKCVLPPGVNPIAVDKYININIKDTPPLLPTGDTLTVSPVGSNVGVSYQSCKYSQMLLRMGVINARNM
jgi:hypothetical protein